MFKSEGIIRLSKKHIKPASIVLSRAFQNDPVIRWQIPEINKRLAKIHHMWEVTLRIGIKYGEVYGTSDNLEGVAIWVPPNNINITYWKYMISGGFRLQFKLGTKIRKRVLFIKAVNDSLQDIFMKFPHWHLKLISIDPKFQGLGFASNLIRPMLKRIDEENLSIYLETNTEKNFSFFEHFGFIKLEEIIIPTTNIISWSMIRFNEI